MQRRSTAHYTQSVQFKTKMAAGNTLNFNSLVGGFKAFNVDFAFLFAVGQNELRRLLNSFVRLFSLGFNSTVATLLSFQLQTVGNHVVVLSLLLVDISYQRLQI
jgi:hypothetical protein